MSVALAVPDRAVLRRGLIGSLAAHVGVVAWLVASRGASGPAMPPVYKVELLAAPAAAAAASVEPPVAAPEAPPALEAPTAAPPARRAEPAGAAKSVPAKAAPTAKETKVATPPATARRSSAAAPTAAPAAPQAASVSGGAGSDVAAVRTDGIAFPYPGYLQNIVRQIAARFRPKNPSAPLQADVAFLLHRDGSVSNVRLVKRSGVYAFDLEAQGAIEAAAAARAFGPLPEGYPDDVLPVTMSFDPRVLR